MAKLEDTIQNAQTIESIMKYERKAWSTIIITRMLFPHLQYFLDFQIYETSQSCFARAGSEVTGWIRSPEIRVWHTKPPWRPNDDEDEKEFSSTGAAAASRCGCFRGILWLATSRFAWFRVSCQRLHRFQLLKWSSGVRFEPFVGFFMSNLMNFVMLVRLLHLMPHLRKCLWQEGVFDCILGPDAVWS